MNTLSHTTVPHARQSESDLLFPLERPAATRLPRPAALLKLASTRLRLSEERNCVSAPRSFVRFGLGGLLMLVGLLSIASQTPAGAEPMDHWSKITVASDVMKSPSEIIHVDGRFWAVGAGGKVQHSTNGTDWTVIQTPSNSTLVSIAYGNGMFVATGYYMTVLSSPNGTDWTIREEDPSNGFATLQQVIYADEKFLAVGHKGKVRISTNGTDWTPATMSGSDFYPEGVVWANGLYVAVGSNDASHTVQTSPDGVTWTRRSTSFTYGLSKVTHFNGLYLAGDTALLATSPDGITWTKLSNIPFPYSNTSVWGMKVINGRAFAHGQHGLLMSSTNGTDWVKHDTGTTADISNVEYDGSALLLTRYSIISSGSGPWRSDPWAPVSNGGGGGGNPGGETGSSQIANLSTRAWIGTGEQQLISGMVVQGSSPKQVLIRAIGPTLGTFGVTGVLADPQVHVYSQGNVEVGSNNDWGAHPNQAGIATATSTVGAFALDAGSKDAVTLVTLQPGPYSIHVSGADGGTGIALVEVYDLDAPGGCRLVNISSRGVVGNGSEVAIPGFVVSGNAPRKLLIRGVGPTLGGYGVAGTIANPKIELYTSTQSKVAENDDWESFSDKASLVAATGQVGAFALNAGSADAAMLVTVQPGAYTVTVSGVSGATGVALVEVYEVP